MQRGAEDCVVGSGVADAGAVAGLKFGVDAVAGGDVLWVELG